MVLSWKKLGNPLSRVYTGTQSIPTSFLGHLDPPIYHWIHRMVGAQYTQPSLQYSTTDQDYCECIMKVTGVCIPRLLCVHNVFIVWNFFHLFVLFYLDLPLVCMLLCVFNCFRTLLIKDKKKKKVDRWSLSHAKGERTVCKIWCLCQLDFTICFWKHLEIFQHEQQHTHNSKKCERHFLDWGLFEF